jgi:endogenous inhibitor of DNA gyrase (YacG/DUF329 family)
MIHFPNEITAAFWCPTCGRQIGVYRETAQVQPYCSSCSKAALPVHPGWIKGAGK